MPEILLPLWKSELNQETFVEECLQAIEDARYDADIVDVSFCEDALLNDDITTAALDLIVSTFHERRWKGLIWSYSHFSSKKELVKANFEKFFQNLRRQVDLQDHYLSKSFASSMSYDDDGNQTGEVSEHIGFEFRFVPVLDSGLTDFHRACRDGKVDNLESLLVANRRGDNDDDGTILTQELNEWTPLYLAICNGHFEVVRFLVENGAVPGTPHKEYLSPVQFANGQHDWFGKICLAKERRDGERVQWPIWRIIADFLSEPKLPASQLGWSLLHEMCSDGNLIAVQDLVDFGIDVNFCDEQGRSPLHLASYGGHLDVVQLLVLRGAEINILNKTNESPLFLASLQGHLEVVWFLVQNSE